jgi:hypothetical protein
VLPNLARFYLAGRNSYYVPAGILAGGKYQKSLCT